MNNEIQINMPSFEIIYQTSDGERFKIKEEASAHEKMLRRDAYYKFLLSRRNWFERLFNLEPDMSGYDMYNL